MYNDSKEENEENTGLSLETRSKPSLESSPHRIGTMWLKDSGSEKEENSSDTGYVGIGYHDQSLISVRSRGQTELCGFLQRIIGKVRSRWPWTHSHEHHLAIDLGRLNLIISTKVGVRTDQISSFQCIMLIPEKKSQHQKIWLPCIGPSIWYL